MIIKMHVNCYRRKRKLSLFATFIVRIKYGHYSMTITEQQPQ